MNIWVLAQDKDGVTAQVDPSEPENENAPSDTEPCQQAEQYEFGKEDGKDINIAALCEALGWPTKRNISYKMRRKEELNKL